MIYTIYKVVPTKTILIKIANSVPIAFSILGFTVPLVLYFKTSELFEFNKMVITYLLTTYILFAWAIKCVLEGKIIFRKTPVDIPLLSFVLSQTISTLLSIDRQTSIFGYYSRFHGGLLSTFTYSILYWAFVSNMNSKNTKMFLYSLLGAGIISSCYGILQHFGIDKDIWVQDVQERVFSTFGQPNWMAAWLVAVLPIVWTLLLIIEGREKTYLKNILFAISALFYWALLYTKSRSGILAFFVLLFLYFGSLILLNNKVIQRSKSLIAKIIAPLFLLTLFIGTPWTPGLSSLINTSVNQTVQQPVVTPGGTVLEVGGTDSGKIRLIVWKGAIDVWRQYPIFGSGVETFAYSYYQHRPIEHNTVSEWNYLYNKAHNEFLNYLATTGLVGLGTYIGLIAAIFFVGIKQLKNAKIWAITLLGAVTTILITNFFGFSVVPVALLFFLYPAIVLSIDKEKQSEAGKLEKIEPSKIGVSLMCFFVFGWITYSIAQYWYADTIYTKGKDYNLSGDYSKAFESLSQSIKLNPREANYHIELAKSASNLSIIAYTQEEATASASLAKLSLAEVDVSSKLSPKNPVVLMYQAQVLLNLLTTYPEVANTLISKLEYAKSLSPTNPRVPHSLGIVYAKLGDRRRSIEYFKQAIELKQDYKEPRIGLAVIYAQEGMKDKAKAELEYIINYIDPKDENVKKMIEELAVN